MAETAHALRELRDRLLVYPADRYPVEHATAQFHLGTTLVDADRAPEAVAALRSAAGLFAEHGLADERAKAANMLGVALRGAGAAAEAITLFGEAADAFAAAGSELEHGAALYNLGLAHRDTGDDRAAAERFTSAQERFTEGEATAQAGAAARELGASRLAQGDPEAAKAVLEEAVELSARAGDHAGTAAAANSLGLACLAADLVDDALRALRDARGANPRSLRPEGFAMVQANLAAAYERADDAPRARLAASQALGTPDASRPVRDQAEELLAQLPPSSPSGRPCDDILAIADAADGTAEETQADEWVALLRDELTRWVDEGPDERRADARAWVEEQTARDQSGVALAEAWLGVALELPPQQMETVIAAMLEALAQRSAETTETFRGQVSRAMVRFYAPQWQRLEATFNRLATEQGQEAAWA
jgi:tetratricopeptide (TPR) repeat protein